MELERENRSQNAQKHEICKKENAVTAYIMYLYFIRLVYSKKFNIHTPPILTQNATTGVPLYFFWYNLI